MALPIKLRYQFRRGHSTEWTVKNPVLLDGEPGLENNTGKYKMGNGVSAWNDLPYYLDEHQVKEYVVEQVALTDSSAQLQEHIQDDTPHPAYDDIPSLVVSFENGLL